MPDKTKPIHIYLPDTPEAQALIYRLKVIATLQKKHLWEVIQEKLRQGLEQAPAQVAEPQEPYRVTQPRQEQRTLAEILAPFRKQVEESGITDEELDALIEQAREEVYQERREKRQP